MMEKLIPYLGFAIALVLIAGVLRILLVIDRRKPRFEYKPPRLPQPGQKAAVIPRKAKSAPKPMPESSPRPAPEPSLEPAPKPSPKPVVEPSPEPSLEPALELSPKSSPEPSPKPSPTPQSEPANGNQPHAPAKQDFHVVLKQAVGDDLEIQPKVRVADVLQPDIGKGSPEWQSTFNKIKVQHLDFVLRDAKTSRVMAVVELDDSSHQGEDKKKRNAFLTIACHRAKIKLVFMPAKPQYSVAEIRQALGWQKQLT